MADASAFRSVSLCNFVVAVFGVSMEELTNSGLGRHVRVGDEWSNGVG